MTTTTQAETLTTMDETLLAAEEARDRGAASVAMTLYRQVARDAAAFFAPDLEARALLALGELLLSEGDEGEARSALEEAVGRAMEGGLPLVEADAHYALAVLAFDAGRSKDGHDALLEAMALYRSLPEEAARRGMARAVRTYGEHIGVLGSPDEAKAALLLSRAMFVDLGQADAAAAIDVELSLLAEYAR